MASEWAIKPVPEIVFNMNQFFEESLHSAKCGGITRSWKLYRRRPAAALKFWRIGFRRKYNTWHSGRLMERTVDDDNLIEKTQKHSNMWLNCAHPAQACPCKHHAPAAQVLNIWVSCMHPRAYACSAARGSSVPATKNAETHSAQWRTRVGADALIVNLLSAFVSSYSGCFQRFDLWWPLMHFKRPQLFHPHAEMVINEVLLYFERLSDKFFGLSKRLQENSVHIQLRSDHSTKFNDRFKRSSWPRLAQGIS